MRFKIYIYIKKKKKITNAQPTLKNAQIGDFAPKCASNLDVFPLASQRSFMR